MAATIQSLVAETKRNRLSLIGPLTEDDVLLVWEKIAQFVETLMMQQKVRYTVKVHALQTTGLHQHMIM